MLFSIKRKLDYESCSLLGTCNTHTRRRKRRLLSFSPSHCFSSTLVSLVPSLYCPAFFFARSKITMCEKPSAVEPWKRGYILVTRDRIFDVGISTSTLFVWLTRLPLCIEHSESESKCHMLASKHTEGPSYVFTTLSKHK